MKPQLEYKLIANCFLWGDDYSGVNGPGKKGIWFFRLY